MRMFRTALQPYHLLEIDTLDKQKSWETQTNEQVIVMFGHFGDKTLSIGCFSQLGILP